MGRALSVKQLLVAFGIAVALIEFGGGLRQVHEGHALLLGQLLHVVGVVHQMVISRHTLLLQYAVSRQLRERVAQVMTTVAPNFAP